MTDPFHVFVVGVLGRHTANGAGGPPRQVLRIVDSQGTPWFAKRFRYLSYWAREVDAYRNWVPHFADQAPRLHASDPVSRGIVVSALPGGAAAIDDTGAHRAAGRLLRRIHECRPSRPPVGTLDLEFDLSLGTAGCDRGSFAASSESFPAGESDFIRNALRDLAEVPPMRVVPGHGDYLPRNWMVDHSEQRVRTLDFANADWQAPAADLRRLFVGPWWGRPHLARAFFDGYGRHLTGDEAAFVRLSLPLLAIRAVRRAHRTADPRMEKRARRRLAQLLHNPRMVDIPTQA